MGDFDPSSNRGVQLSLPLITPREAESSDLSLARTERVYANRNLPLAQIDWLGFDMDYTLAIYNQQAMDSLSVELTLQNLLNFGYPEYLQHLDYDIRFPIRGLLIDKHTGNVLKMNRFAAIHKGYRGFRRLSNAELQTLYWDVKVRPDSERFHWIDTLFGLSEVVSYVSLIEAMERHGERKLDTERIFDDIRKAIDLAHADGRVHNRVLADLQRYVVRDEHLALTLHKLRSAGKKLFLLTNSPWEYTNGMMTYLLGGAMRQYRSWEMYFDVVMVAARKPLWFQGREPFVELRNGKQVTPVTSLERGCVYHGGNLRDFERLTGIRGSRTLYVGDHIYGDILRSKKESAWRTLMIIQELDAEISANEATAGAIRQKVQLEQHRNHQEDELRFYQRRLKSIDKLGDGVDPAEAERLKRGIETVRRSLKHINDEHQQLESFVDTSFHPYWGSLLKEHGELSSFGAQVGRYADVYTRRVSCLRHYSAEQFFRSPHDFMPHEL